VGPRRPLRPFLSPSRQHPRRPHRNRQATLCWRRRNPVGARDTRARLRQDCCCNHHCVSVSIMSLDNTLPTRRSIRFADFDYSQGGQYFLTICAFEMRVLFGKMETNRILLNVIGRIALDCWRDIPNHFPLVELHPFVVMPNHVHGILAIQDGHGCPVPLQNQHRAERFQHPTVASVPTIVRSYKSEVTPRRTLPASHGRFGAYDRPIIQERGYLPCPPVFAKSVTASVAEQLLRASASQRRRIFQCLPLYLRKPDDVAHR